MPTPLPHTAPSLGTFPALESNPQELFHRLMEASRSIYYRGDKQELPLASLWTDHILTVLTEISRTGTSGEQFADLHGTAARKTFTEDLSKKATDWVTRLNNYINRTRWAGHPGSAAVLIAGQIKEQLEHAIPAEGKENQEYYRLLRTINDLGRRTGSYLQQVEDSGDMDGALALLLAYLRGYSGIAEAFNRHLASLPELYRRHILHAVPRGATQDSVYIAVIPSENTKGFTLPEAQPFPAGQNAAGEDLVYQTRNKEYITPMHCAEVNAVYLMRKNGRTADIRRQTLRLQDAPEAETLFSGAHSQSLSLGWMVESPMLVLDEGERKVTVNFRITPGTAHTLPADEQPSRSFTLQLSRAEGWTEQPCTCRISTADGCRRLSLEFTIAWNEAAPAPCTAEMHGTTTLYPALRILTSTEHCPYDWATRLQFDAAEIRTEVTGIRNFTFYNELGEVDTSQPFMPFGIQAEKGAWFLFGNEEMGLKPLKKVRLQGNWKKLPATEEEFDHIYKGYTAAGQPVKTGSFTVAAEWQKDRKWHPCTNGEQHLFIPDNGEDRSLTRAEILFDFTEKKPTLLHAAVPYEYAPDRDGFFRVTLHTPVTGFGTEAYRALFTETMIHNSHCKEKKRKELPMEPLIPMLADVELSYIASEETTPAGMAHSSIRLSRITALSGQKTFPIGKENEQPFLPAFPAGNLLYFAFLRAKGEKTVRMYLDMVLPKEKIPFYNPQPGKSVKLAWEYRNDSGWQPIPGNSVLAEETAGLTQSGFIEISLPEKISDSHLDSQGRMWLCAAVTGDVSSCLAMRSIRTNCIRLTALNGDGTPLPAGTIQGTSEPDERIAGIIQPLPGFGGKPAETETGATAHQSSRISNRHRAITIKDYEQLVMEHFPEIDKAQCITVPQKESISEICLVVFSRAEDNRYCLSPAWKLAEIQRLIRQYAPPFVPLRVINPVYEQVKIHCKAILHDSVQDEGKALRQLTVLAQNYIAPWYRKGGIPALRQQFSYKELHARMVNHEDLMKLVALEVNGISLSNADIDTKDHIFKGTHPWSVLLPKIKTDLLFPNAGINHAEIGGNFIIK